MPSSTSAYSPSPEYLCVWTTSARQGVIVMWAELLQQDCSEDEPPRWPTNGFLATYFTKAGYLFFSQEAELLTPSPTALLVGERKGHKGSL